MSPYVLEYCERQEKTRLRVHEYGNISAVLRDFASVFVVWALALSTAGVVFMTEMLWCREEERKSGNLVDEMSVYFSDKGSNEIEEFRRIFYGYLDSKK